MTVAFPSVKLPLSFVDRLLGVLIAALMVCRLAAPALAGPDDTPNGPIAVSDDEHLWFFEPSGVPGNSRVIVLHHGPGHAPGEAEQASVVEDMPEAALAVNDRLYCVFRGKRDPAGGFQNRSVSTLRAEAFDESTQSWTYEPAQRARTVEALPGAGRVGGIVAAGRDPLVLLVPNPQLAQDENGQGKPSASATTPALPRLLRLTLGQWREVELPDAARRARNLSLIGGARPILMATSADGADSRSMAYTLESDGQWSSSSVDLQASQVFDSTQHEGQTYVAVKSDGDDAIGVLLLRLPHVYPIIQIKHPVHQTRLISLGSNLAIAEAPPEQDRLVVTPIDVEAGTVDEPQVFMRQMRPAFEDFSLLVLVGALLFASLVMFIFRPADPARMTVSLPKGTRIAEPRRRIGALLIDLLPAALLTGLILDVSMTNVLDITRMPMRARQLEESWPMILMFLICIGHCTICELLWGRTLGKALLDCWVVGIDGKRPRLMSILVRNAMKFVALCVPLLFLFVYINQYRQRLGDLAARTVVITHGESTEPSDASLDRDA